MTGKFYMFFRDDCDRVEQLHWFIDNYMPADRQSFEHRYAEGMEAQENIREGTLGVYTWDNGRFWSLCFLDVFTTREVTQHTQVFYKPDTITIGELQ